MKYEFSPGNSLYIGMGIIMRFGDSGQSPGGGISHFSLSVSN